MDLRVFEKYAATVEELEQDIKKYLKIAGWTVEEYLRECDAILAASELAKRSLGLNKALTQQPPINNTKFN